jgi:hypothetical protein
LIKVSVNRFVSAATQQACHSLNNEVPILRANQLSFVIEMLGFQGMRLGGTADAY